MEFLEFVKPELAILILACYVLGVFIKKSAMLDWKIPFVLTGVSIFLAILYLFATVPTDTAQDIAMLLFVGLTQGIATAGIAVLGNQMVQQATAGRKEDEQAVRLTKMIG